MASTTHLIERKEQWGTVLSGSPLQASAWLAGAQGPGLPGNESAVTHSPATTSMPGTITGSRARIGLDVGGFLIGRTLLPMSRSVTDLLPSTVAGAPDVEAIGSAYADITADDLEIGWPYLPNHHGGIQLSPIGVHLEGLEVIAVGRPGRPVRFGLTLTRGFVSIEGVPFAELPHVVPPNYEVHVPIDPAQGLAALIVFNEQVTTDHEGRPTQVPESGRPYVFDPDAVSGYVNAAHLMLPGSSPVDITVGHAAVLQP
ncbi:hypothetical protein GCM10022223_05210 [Kineosporia mesophila]|uniref:Uncharacterized protein n=1 Tax=Kineosporia mesophila TaxID=566012 RepID=A0ABP6Z015_9ACTN|nr:hypothetical protein [Kineosporia mesophila]MCD5354270.1 hypothetical protein [Kineosporia mesophila]